MQHEQSCFESSLSEDSYGIPFIHHMLDCLGTLKQDDCIESESFEENYELVQQKLSSSHTGFEQTPRATPMHYRDMFPYVEVPHALPNQNSGMISMFEAQAIKNYTDCFQVIEVPPSLPKQTPDTQTISASPPLDLDAFSHSSSAQYTMDAATLQC